METLAEVHERKKNKRHAAIVQEIKNTNNMEKDESRSQDVLTAVRQTMSQIVTQSLTCQYVPAQDPKEDRSSFQQLGAKLQMKENSDFKDSPLRATRPT